MKIDPKNWLRVEFDNASSTYKIKLVDCDLFFQYYQRTIVDAAGVIIETLEIDDAKLMVEALKAKLKAQAKEELSYKDTMLVKLGISFVEEPVKITPTKP